jgi:NAD(P)-dependent dehydrogenase (short-subunit alcohol dehydrogenase family)
MRAAAPSGPATRPFVIFEEIANAIMFIGSDKASYIIGASLAVDGGMIAD